MTEIDPVDIVQVITDTERRGAQVSASWLAPELIRRGLSVRTVALVPGASPALDVDVLGTSPFGARTLLLLRSHIRSAGVVIAHGSKTLPASFLASMGTGVPFIYRNIGDPKYWSASGTRRVRTRLLLSRAAGVVSLTDATARSIHELFGVRNERLTTIPQAVAPDDFPVSTPARRAEARKALGVDPDDRLAVCIGALSPEKDVGTAVQAMASLPPRWRLLIAGDGPDQTLLAGEAAKLGHRVRLLGRVDRPADLLTAADLLVLPSLTEGLPSVVIEAAMTGIGAVVTDVGFVRDIVDHEVSGFVVPPNDPAAMAAAIQQAETHGLEELGFEAHRRAIDRFSLPAAADRWAELVRSISRRTDEPTRAR